eukprot:scaffold1340_cov253-Pinguiococcus_pyrenoidosus.AAC.7
MPQNGAKAGCQALRIDPCTLSMLHNQAGAVSAVTPRELSLFSPPFPHFSRTFPEFYLFVGT